MGDPIGGHPTLTVLFLEPELVDWYTSNQRRYHVELFRGLSAELVDCRVVSTSGVSDFF